LWQGGVERRCIMKKLLIAIALALSLAFGGCAGVQPKNNGGAVVEQYHDLQFHKDSKVFKIPNSITDLNGEGWSIKDTTIAKNTYAFFISREGEGVTMLVVFDGKELILMVLIHSKKVGEDYTYTSYIYDGKMFPRKVEEEEMKSYIEKVIETQSQS
jgi:hypothetical protein